MPVWPQVLTQPPPNGARGWARRMPKRLHLCQVHSPHVHSAVCKCQPKGLAIKVAQVSHLHSQSGRSAKWAGGTRWPAHPQAHIQQKSACPTVAATARCLPPG